MSFLDMLEPLERNVVILATRTEQNFAEVARILGLKDAKEAEGIYHHVRLMLIRKLHGPAPEGWLSISRMAAVLGLGHYSVARRVEQFRSIAIPHEYCGKVFMYYPPQVLSVLRVLLQKTFGEAEAGWYSLRGLARGLEAAYKWVKRRISQFDHLAARRRSNGGKSTLYYPPAVFEALQTIRAADKSLPYGGDYRNIKQICDEIHKSRVWVLNTLQALGAKPQKRRDLVEKVVDYYPPAVVPLLQALADTLPPPGDWLTVHRIAQMVGADRSWVEKRISELSIPGEVRCQLGYGRPTLYYPPKTTSLLKPLYIRYQPAGNWQTANAIVAATGSSSNWVGSQLAGYPSELRTDNRGVLRKHYSPETAEKLMSQYKRQELLHTRNLPALALRQRVLELLNRSDKDLTVEQLGRSCGMWSKQGQKNLQAALHFLRQKKLVDSLSVPGQGIKYFWHITPLGREVLSLVKAEAT